MCVTVLQFPVLPKRKYAVFKNSFLLEEQTFKYICKKEDDCQAGLFFKEKGYSVSNFISNDLHSIHINCSLA